MTAKAILEKFGFTAEEEPVSIYPFSPVYKVAGADAEFIIKKTQSPLAKAHRLMAYTGMLQEQGIKVVTPAPMADENPAAISEAVYVMYPFIKGEAYSARDREIEEAGSLLGELHAASPVQNAFGLDVYDVFDFTAEEVEASFRNIEKHAARFGMAVKPEVKARLHHAVSRQSSLKEAGLPVVATPHDFKANNLVYTPEPYLIDPDNAAWVPRIFDLALALLLFHNELATAPARPFSAREWALFLGGYTQNAALTEQEITWWPEALGHVFLDEVMWLMADVEDDWQNPVQRRLFEGLLELFMDPEAYSLAPGRMNR